MTYRNLGLPWYSWCWSLLYVKRPKIWWSGAFGGNWPLGCRLISVSLQSWPLSCSAKGRRKIPAWVTCLRPSSSSLTLWDQCFPWQSLPRWHLNLRSQGPRNLLWQSCQTRSKDPTPPCWLDQAKIIGQEQPCLRQGLDPFEQNVLFLILFLWSHALFWYVLICYVLIVWQWDITDEWWQC